MPPETRTSLISLSGSTVVHSFPILPRPGARGPHPPPPRGLWHSFIYVGLISKITYPNECERTRKVGGTNPKRQTTSKCHAARHTVRRSVTETPHTEVEAWNSLTQDTHDEGFASQCDQRAPHSVREIRLSVMTLGWSASLGWYM